MAERPRTAVIMADVPGLDRIPVELLDEVDLWLWLVDHFAIPPGMPPARVRWASAGCVLAELEREVVRPGSSELLTPLNLHEHPSVLTLLRVSPTDAVSRRLSTCVGSLVTEDALFLVVCGETADGDPGSRPVYGV